MRRSTKVSQQLEEARQRYADQQAKQREQEQVVDAALAAYFDAAGRITAAETECRRRAVPHERAIERLRTTRNQVMAAEEEEQGLAALALSEAERTVEQISELLGQSRESTRRLIGVGREIRAARAQVATDPSATDSQTAREKSNTHAETEPTATGPGQISAAGVNDGEGSAPVSDAATHHV
ncbi:MAG TPA: hypothetical protein VFG15_03360 [Amycolatopsis sp.]|nr:hypothetical protein [Amycolatopsis sp.]